jgi:hypothetical protein
MQESKIQQLQAGEASRLQSQERAGEVYAESQRRAGAETARGLDWSKTGTLLGMSQERVAAANQARAEAKAQQMSSVGDMAGGLSQLAGGIGMKKAAGAGVPVDYSQMQESYVDPFEQMRLNAIKNAKMREENAPDTTLKSL